LEKRLISLAQYRAETGLRLQPTGAASCHARSAEKPAGPWPGSPAQRGKRRQGVAGDLDGVTGKVPGKEERAVAHWNGGSTVMREESFGTAAFAGGEGAPVVVVECDEVLQLGRGKGWENCKKSR
jgi:hypothetical protein